VLKLSEKWGWRVAGSIAERVADELQPPGRTRERRVGESSRQLQRLVAGEGVREHHLHIEVAVSGPIRPTGGGAEQVNANDARLEHRADRRSQRAQIRGLGSG